MVKEELPNYNYLQYQLFCTVMCQQAVGFGSGLIAAMPCSCATWWKVMEAYRCVYDCCNMPENQSSCEPCAQPVNVGLPRLLYVRAHHWFISFSVRSEVSARPRHTQIVPCHPLVTLKSHLGLEKQPHILTDTCDCCLPAVIVVLLGSNDCDV